MAGLIPGIGLVNNFDANGQIMAGAKLRIYAAGSLTPVTAFKNSGLTADQELPWPVEADAAGRLPLAFLPDGAYRVRLSTEDGDFVAYDVASVPTVGPSSGGGGGGGTSVATQSLYQTGDIKHRLGNGTHDGFVRVNGRTLGSATSGATERANSDTAALYDLLWNGLPDSICAVSGGRGISSAADFAANKPMTLPDASGCTLVGADNMGGGARSILTTFSFSDSSQIGATGGNEKHTITASESAALTLTTTLTASKDVITGVTTVGVDAASPTASVNSVIAVDPLASNISATTTSNAGGLPHPNLQPSMIVTIYVKL